MDGSLGAPAEFYELLIMPLLATFFGLMVRFVGWNKERSGANAITWKWVSIAILAIGVYAGFRTMYNLFDPQLGSLYRETIWQRRVLYSHYFAFGVPLVALLAVLGWNITEKKLGRPLAI